MTMRLPRLYRLLFCALIGCPLSGWTQAPTIIEVEDVHAVEIVGKSFSGHLSYTMTKGDFNGDGVADLATGSFREHDVTETVFNVGLVSVFFGGSQIGDLPSPPAVTQVGQLTGDPPQPMQEDIAIYGVAEDESAGGLVAAGDLDGDQIDDLIVVAQDDNPLSAKPDRSKIGIKFGASNFHGLYSFPADMDVLLSRDVAHYCAVTVGDLDNDGYDDLVIADDLTKNIHYLPVDVSRDVNGSVYVLYGKPRAAWSATYDLKTQADLQLTRSGGEGVFQVKSLTTGDISADGVVDLVMGAPKEEVPSRELAGRVFVRLGGSRVTGQVDIDSYASSVISGAEERDRTGGELEKNLDGHPLAIGDVNADGIGDLVIGSPLSWLGVVNSTGVGKVEVVFGRSPFPTALDLASDADVRLILGGNPRFFYTGKAVLADDLNNDGVSDIAISSPAWHANPANPRSDGIVHIVFGGPDLAGSYELVTEADLAFEAPRPTHPMSGSKMGSTFLVGDLNGNGDADIVLGGHDGGLSTRGWAAVITDVIRPLRLENLQVTGSSLTLEWTGRTGWSYELMSCQDLPGMPQDWIPVDGSAQGGVDGPMSATVSVPAARDLVYRLKSSQ